MESINNEINGNNIIISNLNLSDSISLNVSKTLTIETIKPELTTETIIALVKNLPLVKKTEDLNEEKITEIANQNESEEVKEIEIFESSTNYDSSSPNKDEDKTKASSIDPTDLIPLITQLKPLPDDPIVITKIPIILKPNLIHSLYKMTRIAQQIASGKCKNIIVMTGAGISVSAGIPDFRTPGTGLYDNLAKYKLPHATAVFELKYFRFNPKPFFLLAKELYPTCYTPTPTHHFISLLHGRSVLKRNFTQNIDGLEHLTGLSEKKVIAAHGNFNSAHCILCKKEYKVEDVKETIFANEIPYCDDCPGLVKPDIVFFGESLPQRYFDKSSDDFPKCDLLIVCGTSLKVQPFASLIKQVPDSCPRLLINNECVGEKEDIKNNEDKEDKGFDFISETSRDCYWESDCDSGVRKLCELIGSDWIEELENRVKTGYKGTKQ